MKIMGSVGEANETVGTVVPQVVQSVMDQTSPAA